MLKSGEEGRGGWGVGGERRREGGVGGSVSARGGMGAGFHVCLYVCTNLLFVGRSRLATLASTMYGATKGV